jgi:FKBP-type peptidyl-prolyl cis-trans isomerase SlyD
LEPDVADNDASPTIKPGHTVALAFSMRTEEGELLEERTENDPLHYVHGSGTLVRGLEVALSDRAAGDRFDLKVAPEDAFGPRTEGGARRLERSSFPHRGELIPGMPFVMQGDDGKLAALWITGVDGDTIEVDSNHPLAGKTLLFEVTVLAVRAATETELTHGEAAHGPPRPTDPAD